MKTTIDAAGRLVIPKELRRKAGLSPGTEVEVRYADGKIEIEPSPSKIRLVQKGRFLVAEVEGEAPTLTAEDVRRLLEELRDERGMP